MKELTDWLLLSILGIVFWGIAYFCAVLIEKVCTRCSNDSEDEYRKTMREVFVSLVWVAIAFNFALISHHVAIKDIAIQTHVFAHIDYILLIPNVWFAFALTRQKEWALIKRSYGSFVFCMAMPIPCVMTNLKALKMRPSLTMICILLGIGFLTFTVSALRDTKIFHPKDNGVIRQTLLGRMEPFLFWFCTIAVILVCGICHVYQEYPEKRGTSNISVEVGKLQSDRQPVGKPPPGRPPARLKHPLKKTP